MCNDRVLMTVSTARRMFDLVEPIGVIPYSADEPNEAMFALGFTNYWDTYFAGRAAPLGLVPAEGVADDHSRGSDRRPSDRLRERAEADSRRSHRHSRVRSRRRTVDQGGHQ